MKISSTKSLEISYRSLLEERVNSSYALRKNKLQLKNYQERADLISQMNKIDSVLEIKPNEISITSDLQSQFISSSTETKLGLACTCLTSNIIDAIKYGLYSIRKIIEDNPNQIEQIITLEVIHSLCSCILLQEDLSIYYEACTSLINLTKTSSNFIKLLAEDKYLKVFIQLFLKQSDIRIRSQILLILGNMIEELETPFLLQIQSQLNLCQIVLDYIANDSKVSNDEEHSMPLVSKWIMFWFIGIVIKYIPPQNIHELINKSLPAFKGIITHVSTNLNKKLFSEALSCIRNLFHQTSDCSSLLLLLEQIDLYSILPKYVSYSMPSSNLIDLFEILLTLTYSNNEAVDSLFCSHFFMNTASFLHDYYSKKCSSKKMPMMSLLNVLLNCTQCSNGKNYIVRKTSVAYYLCEIVKEVNDKAIVKSILSILLECLDDNRSDIKCEMVRIEVPEVFMLKLSNSNETEVIAMCLKGIDLFLSFGTSIVKEKNILKELFEMSNVVEMLEKLTNHQDQHVSSYANQLITCYFEK